jgi:hypothetical protein
LLYFCVSGLYFVAFTGNHIVVVMVIILASSIEYLSSSPGRIKSETIQLVCVASPPRT